MAAGIARKCAINVSFSGCGFLGMYHIGVLARLREGQDSEKDSFAISSALGASAGALGNFLSYPIIMRVKHRLKCQQIHVNYCVLSNKYRVSQQVLNGKLFCQKKLVKLKGDLHCLARM